MNTETWRLPLSGPLSDFSVSTRSELFRVAPTKALFCTVATRFRTPLRERLRPTLRTRCPVMGFSPPPSSKLMVGLFFTADVAVDQEARRNRPGPRGGAWSRPPRGARPGPRARRGDRIGGEAAGQDQREAREDQADVAIAGVPCGAHGGGVGRLRAEQAHAERDGQPSPGLRDQLLLVEDVEQTGGDHCDGGTDEPGVGVEEALLRRTLFGRRFCLFFGGHARGNPGLVRLRQGLLNRGQSRSRLRTGAHPEEQPRVRRAARYFGSEALAGKTALVKRPSIAVIAVASPPARTRAIAVAP